MTSVCRGERAPNCAIHVLGAEPTHVPPPHREPIWVCSHLKTFSYTLEVMTQQTGPLEKRRLVFLCRTSCNFNKWLNLAQIYLWIQIGFPTLCPFIPPCVTTRVTHTWITAEKSCGEFSAALSCRNLVLFDDSILNGSLYISTPLNIFLLQASLMSPILI